MLVKQCGHNAEEHYGHIFEEFVLVEYNVRCFECKKKLGTWAYGNYYEVEESSVDELIGQVEQWSKNKGLDKADSSKQFLKVVEEVGEVAAALARKDENALRDGIGDVVVTLIILAQQNGMDLYECLNCAYDEIKGRTGQMVDGVFVKSEDL